MGLTTCRLGRLEVSISPDKTHVVVTEKATRIKLAELEIASVRPIPVSTLTDDEITARLRAWGAENGWSNLEERLVHAEGAVDYELLLPYSENMQVGGYDSWS